MLPQMHSLVSSDSAVEAIRAAARERPVHTIEEAALHCQLPGAEESRLDDRSMVVNCPHPEHEAVGVIGISEDISTMAKISTSQSGYDARVGPREHEEGDPEVEENGGTDPDNGDSERDEESWTAMLIDIDTPDDLKHADVIDEQRRQLAEIENQKKIADCPKSWTCLKCSVLNAHRSRSCDSCADKKPPPVLVPRVKFPGPGRPRDMSKTSQPTVKKSHKKKESTSSPEEQLVRVSKPQMGGPLMTLDVKTEKMTAAGKEDGLIIQPIKKSHKKKVVLSVPAEITAGTLPVREGTVSTATA